MKASILGVALAAPILLSVAAGSRAAVSIGVSVNFAPPALPVYEQPPIPADGYLWTPGFWAYGPDGYYWVPGTWVAPPQPGLLWTPGYWAFGSGGYLWHGGYWGPRVGFYGGVNYGYGYGGVGFEGGYWRGGRFNYNRSVTNVNNSTVVVKNVYNKTVINNVTVNRVSYNGGNGTSARPNAVEREAERDRHVQITAGQRDQEQTARNDRSLRASVNHGAPPVAATERPAKFDTAVPAKNSVRPAGNNDRPGRNNAASEAQRIRADRPPSASGQPAVSTSRPRDRFAPNAARDSSRRDNSPRDNSPRDNLPRDNSPRDSAPRDRGEPNNRPSSRPDAMRAAPRHESERGQPRGEGRPHEGERSHGEEPRDRR